MHHQLENKRALVTGSSRDRCGHCRAAGLISYFSDISSPIFHLSGQSQRLAYDSAYMALAQAQGVWFFTTGAPACLRVTWLAFL